MTENLFTREQVVEQILNYRARIMTDWVDSGEAEKAKIFAATRVPDLLEDFLADHEDIDPEEKP